jgi:zinc transport system substrate-binding protein
MKEIAMLRLIFAFGFVVFLSLSAHAAAPKVVTTIVPLHSLVTSVMKGVGTPKLLLPGGASPHNSSLRPSYATAIEEADVVFWFGETFESGLARAMKALPRGEVVSLLQSPDLILLPAREGGLWEAEDGEDGDHNHDHAHDSNDAHVWLDPENGAVLASYIEKTLSRVYPQHAGRFEANASDLINRLKELEHDLDRRLAPIRDAPYLVFHDAYQYFENRFRLSPVGSITVNPERAPGAKRLAELRRRLTTGRVLCVFQEPQFDSGSVNTIVSGTPTKIGVLDPLGADIPPGPDAYFTLMGLLADGLTGCLGAS